MIRNQLIRNQFNGRVYQGTTFALVEVRRVSNALQSVEQEEQPDWMRVGLRSEHRLLEDFFPSHKRQCKHSRNKQLQIDGRLGHRRGATTRRAISRAVANEEGATGD